MGNSDAGGRVLWLTYMGVMIGVLIAASEKYGFWWGCLYGWGWAGWFGYTLAERLLK